MAWGQHNTLNLNHPKKQLFVCFLFIYLFKKHVIGVIWIWFFFPPFGTKLNKRQWSEVTVNVNAVFSLARRGRFTKSKQWLPFCASAEDGMRHTLVFSIQAAVCQLVAVGRVNSLNTLGLKTLLLFCFFFFHRCVSKIFSVWMWSKNLASFQH